MWCFATFLFFVVVNWISLGFILLISQTSCSLYLFSENEWIIMKLSLLATQWSSHCSNWLQWKKTSWALRAKQQHWKNLKAPIRRIPLQHFGHQGWSSAVLPRMQCASQRLTHTWHWSLGCHQGLRVLLVMTGQRRARIMIVSLHIQDPLKRTVIHSTFYFGGVWFEFRVDLV